MKDDLSKLTTLVLAHKLNELMKKIEEMEINGIKDLRLHDEYEKEYDDIVMELWRRIPSLEKDVNIQPKRKVRKNVNR